MAGWRVERITRYRVVQVGRTSSCIRHGERLDCSVVFLIEGCVIERQHAQSGVKKGRLNQHRSSTDRRPPTAFILHQCRHFATHPIPGNQRSNQPVFCRASPAHESRSPTLFMALLMPLPAITSIHNMLNPHPLARIIFRQRTRALLTTAEICWSTGQAESCGMSEGIPGRRTHRWVWASESVESGRMAGVGLLGSSFATQALTAGRRTSRAHWKMLNGTRRS